ncbi:MAG: type II toxin-antitoxin system Phd/YefM family antitoxin, partial [Mycobacteriales bacterium]
STGSYTTTADLTSEALAEAQGRRRTLPTWREYYVFRLTLFSATFVYMSELVGVAELRQNLSVYLRRVSGGERLVVTDRNRPVAELGPVPSTGPDLDRLIAEGRVSRPVRSGLPEPLELTGDPRALSRALDDIRGDR